MAGSGIRTRHFWFTHCDSTPHMYYTRHQGLCSLELSASWAVSGKRKKLPLLNFIISFQKLFRRKIAKMPAKVLRDLRRIFKKVFKLWPREGFERATYPLVSWKKVFSPFMQEVKTSDFHCRRHVCYASTLTIVYQSGKGKNSTSEKHIFLPVKSYGGKNDSFFTHKKLLICSYVEINFKVDYLAFSSTCLSQKFI